ncbi:MAG: plasmid mobilization relaxosome protein MobC [Marinomonas sp.]
MSAGVATETGQATVGFNDVAAAAPKAGKRRDRSPLTLRLTTDERQRLEELAAGMTLSAYVRACVFGAEAAKRKRRPKDVVEDKKAAAEALALLGQSRIASNLNQLAYHANIGALIVGEQEKANIAEANAHLRAIRTLLVKALGKSR